MTAEHDPAAAGPDHAADRAHFVADGPLHRRIPGNAGLHRDKDTGDHQNRGNGRSPAVSGEGNHGELRGDGARVAKICDGALLHRYQVPGRVGADGFPQMVFDFLLHASSKRAIETELAPQPFKIVDYHAGFSRGRVPPSRPPIAAENCFQTARRSTSARFPDRVSV